MKLYLTSTFFFLPDNDKWPVENPNFILIRFFPKTVKQISVMVTTFWSVGNKEIKKIHEMNIFLPFLKTALLSYIRKWHNFRFS